ncbi:MAG: DNA replication/repair protein RecF, partial [Pseudomonadota bacterium]
ARGGRVVRIDGAAQKSANVLADYTEMMWLTPASDGLFTGPAAERRRFLDRLVLCFDPAHGTRSNQFDRAMRQRNKLFEIGARSDREFTGLEDVLAQTGVAIAAARATLVERLQSVIARRRETSGETAFPDAVLALDGGLEQALASEAASDVEEAYRARLAQNRGRDHAARRTLEGPHRSDLVVTHGPKDMIARLCSTGEQKALLVGLVLAHADMLARRAKQAAPFLLLDEIAAHLDAERRAALFDELSALGSQAWMTGTDRAQFAHLDGRATFFEVTDGHVAPI